MENGQSQAVQTQTDDSLQFMKQMQVFESFVNEYVFVTEDFHVVLTGEVIGNLRLFASQALGNCDLYYSSLIECQS